MSCGQIVLANTKSGFIPAAIKWMTNSQFSHSFIKMPDIFCNSMCIEASEKGVDMLLFDPNYLNNLQEGYQVWNIKIEQSVKDKAMASILSDLEISYGYLEFFWFVWRKICSIFGKDIKAQNNWAVNSGIICSQLCVAYLKSCGLSGVLAGYGDGAIAPGDLYNIFVSNPQVFELIDSTRL